MWTKSRMTDEEISRKMVYINGTPTIQTAPSVLPFTFEIEHTFDQVKMLEWFKENWHTSIYCCALYLVAIFVGQKVMADRKPFKLRKALILWNLSLATYSIYAALRGIDEFIYSYKNFGFHYTACDGSAFQLSPAVGFWGYLFAMSKLVEFGDTAFIVLRKQKLIFLHWYHHITVCTYVWFIIPYEFAPARWFGTMNVIVHSFMYSYYTVRSAGYRVPKLIAMSITFLQIMQMFAGTFVTAYTYLNLDNCPYVQRPPIYLGIVMYGSYLVLFVRFFVRAYFYGFAKAAAETAGKSSILVDQNANTIEEKKFK